MPRIKLDLTADELVFLPPVRVPIFHPYTDAPEGGVEALAYDYVEAFAEKFRALAERTRPRDLYDVVNLYRNTEARPDPVRFLEVLRAKCEFKGIGIPRLADLNQHKTGLVAGWQNMLAHQLPALLPVESFWDALSEIFAWLEGPTAPTPLAAFPIAGSNEIVRERTLILPVGAVGQSHVETIRFAAANRLLVNLDYRDQQGRRRIRAIEAYSLRRSQAGDILLMAVRADDGQPRSYRLDSIVGVEMTQRTFVPRYPIELNPAGPQVIPSTSRPSAASVGRVRTPVRRSMRRTGSSGPIYVFRCTVCHKEFSHKSMDGRLRAHRNQSGRDCYGRYGTYVRTRY